MEITKEGQSIRCDVSSCVGVTQTRGDGGCNQCQTSNDSSRPRYTFLVNGLSVGELCLYASKGLAGFGWISAVDVDLDSRIQIRNTISDAWDAIDGVRFQLDVRLDIELASRHGAETLQLFGAAWINLLFQEDVTVDRNFDVERHISRDGGDSDNVEGDGSIVGCEDDVKETGRETRVGLARIERSRFN